MPSRRRRLLVCWALLSGWFLCRLASGWLWPTDARPFATPLLIDINRADVPTLMTLPGVGRHRAAAILLHRVRHGPFRQLDHLLRVEGFGATGLARLRPFLRPLRR